MTGATIPADETDAQRILREAYADCGCGIPSPFDEVAEHAVTLAEAKGFERGRLYLADQPSPPVVEGELVDRLTNNIETQRVLIDQQPAGSVEREAARLAYAVMRDARTAILAALSSPTVREAAQFLSDRLDSLEWMEDDLAGTCRDYFGHVEPAHARLKAALAQGGEVEA